MSGLYPSFLFSFHCVFVFRVFQSVQTNTRRAFKLILRVETHIIFSFVCRNFICFEFYLINSTIDRLISSVKKFCVCVNRQNEIQFDLHCTIFFCLFPLPCRDRYLAFYSAHKGAEYTVFRTNSKESFLFDLFVAWSIFPPRFACALVLLIMIWLDMRDIQNILLKLLPS